MSLIRYEFKNGVGIITLNRPDKFNSFNREMALELQEKLDHCQQDELVRCVYIIGEGKAFCAGQDLGEAIDPSGPGIARIVREHYNPIIEKIRQLNKPVVAAVNGVAAGAGANIALCCDIVVAGKSASFIQAFAKIGLIPDSGGTFFLPRMVGMQRAAALMMLGDKINGEQAETMGMIYKAFSDETLVAESLAIAETLAQLPTVGLALTKKALNASWTNNLEQQLMLEEELQTQAGLSADHREGVNAFLEKRKAVFTGK
jgi:2-(1,2-epoxy-1,2-dihydrophenyl)acetyl-CoA isomerase